MSENELSNNLEIDSDEDDETEEEEEQSSSSSSSSAGPPVKLSIKTALQSSLVDQHLEFTASRKRTILSLKQAISKTMRGRPPLSCIQLKYHGRVLDDEEETVDDIILADMDDEDEEEDESDGESDIGEEDNEDIIKLTLTCDIIPPIDSKFGIEFREKITKLSTREIMEAYCLNMAGMVYGQELQVRESELYERDHGGHEDEDEDDWGGEEEQLVATPSSTTTTTTDNHSLNIRKKAAIIQKQFESTLSSETRQLMQEEHERVKNVNNNEDGDDDGDYGRVVYGLVSQGNNNGASAQRSGRKGRTLKGGATMNVKRVLQRNLNVNWADTTRNSLLFLFFGYFGGRNSFSRTFLLLSSPLCFFIQTRPVKVAMKQLFYTIGEPPGILLSLLPAPQQAIMSLDYGGVMRGLYDEKVLEGEEWWGGMEEEEEEQHQWLGESDDDGSSLEDFEFDNDEYDDDDSEYDSDDDY
ncbi:hypothetical protein ACHAXR_002293 [Thalassiosira sp. AJA248-18]